MSKFIRILNNPWDFTLYEENNGSYVIKVMFSEGEYKVDIARCFTFTHEEVNSLVDMENIKVLSENIRKNYASYKAQEISKQTFDALLQGHMI